MQIIQNIQNISDDELIKLADSYKEEISRQNASVRMLQFLYGLVVAEVDNRQKSADHE